MLTYYGCWWLRSISWTLQVSAIFVSVAGAAFGGGVGGVVIGGMVGGTAMFCNVLATNVC
jgi:hypothetical protein